MEAWNLLSRLILRNSPDINGRLTGKSLRFYSFVIDSALIFLSPSFSLRISQAAPISVPNLCIISGGQQPLLPASIFSAEKFLKIFLEVYLFLLLRVLITPTRNSRLFSLAKPFQGLLAPFHFLFSLPPGGGGGGEWLITKGPINGGGEEGRKERR